MAKKYSEEITNKIEKAMVAYFQYQMSIMGYGATKGVEDLYNMEKFRKIVNENVENCEKHIPKSLIDKLEIKKIE